MRTASDTFEPLTPPRGFAPVEDFDTEFSLLEDRIALRLRRRGLRRALQWHDATPVALILSA